MKKLLIILFLFAFVQVQGQKVLTSQGQVMTYNGVPMVYGAAAPVVPFSPLDVDSCVLWLKADAGVTLNGSTVSAWADQSGNGNDAVQATAANQPLYVANQLNGEPVIRFDGSNDYLIIADDATMRGMYGLSIYVVGKRYSTYSCYLNSWEGGSDIRNHYIFGNNFGAKADFYTGTSISSVGGSYTYTVTTSYYLLNGIYNGSKMYIYANGSLDATTYNQTGHIGTGIKDTYIGTIYNLSYFTQIDVCEIIMYSNSNSTVQRQQVENYLNAKYAIY